MYKTTIEKWDSQKLGTFSQDDIRAFAPHFDQLGVESGETQGLDGPITSTEKLLSTPDQCCIIYCDTDHGKPLGFVKYGLKDLYVYKKLGKGKVDYIPMAKTMCVLDFYVSTKEQRRGIGLIMFKHMLEDMGKDPPKLAYDRPSPLLLGFLSRHYGMTDPDPQPNRYTIYEGFF